MAIFEQVRDVELVSGASEAFVITSRMVSANIPVELPHVNVFVLSIADVNDPKQDTLARVAQIADLSSIPIGRDQGIATPGPNGLEYLSASTVNSYDTLETANDAATALQDRVNALVTDWITFKSSFSAPDPSPAMYTFPRVNPTQLTQLINVYAAAKQARYQDQLANTSAIATTTSAFNDFTYKQGLVSGALAILNDAQKSQSDTTVMNGAFVSDVAAGTALSAASTTFYNANTGGSGAATFLVAVNTFNAAHLTATSQLSQLSTYSSDASKTVTDATNYYNARVTDMNAAQAAYSSAQSAQIAAGNVLVAAQATEAAALAAVIAVCPNFDKTTVPLVPDA